MLDLFTQLTILVVLAAALGIAARLLGQPTILAYLAAGMIVGFFDVFGVAEHKEVFDLFADLGIMFLLFLVGLEINYESLRLVGKDAVIIGLGQVLFTFLAGFGIAAAFGFKEVAAFYIALALTFSSTIIAVNFLSEKKDLNSVYGKISVGMLLIQDMVVILALVLLTGAGVGSGILDTTFLGDIISGLGGAATTIAALALALIEAAVIFAIAFAASKRLIPTFFNAIARSEELVFLSALAWLFLLTSLSDTFGFSREIGGFIAGLTLANSFGNLEIAHRMRPLRDFFLLVFFVILGTSVVAFSNFGGIGVLVVVFSLLVLVGNPLIVLILMGLLGYTKRVSFMTGMVIAQISEFSLILAALGMKLGHIDESVVTLITAVGVITITLSSYMITNDERLYRLLAPLLGIFEREHTKKFVEPGTLYRRPIVITGFHRTGKSIAHTLPREHVLVLDFDPEARRELESAGFAHLFGDMTDPDMLSHIDWREVRAVISTCPDIEDNVLFLRELKRRRKKQQNYFKIIVRARTEREAHILYREGADYVLLPHFSAGRYFAKIVQTDPFLHSLSSLKEKDQKLMRSFKNGRL